MFVALPTPTAVFAPVPGSRTVGSVTYVEFSHGWTVVEHYGSTGAFIIKDNV